jgi:L-seryl-tRNA(Ser) seleniumtransferase
MTLASIPSVDRILRLDGTQALIHEWGRTLVTDSIRSVLADVRRDLQSRSASAAVTEDMLVARLHAHLVTQSPQSLRRVFNLTGTILHTNLGRAQLPDVAIEAMTAAARHPSNVEFDLARGSRGDRDDHVTDLLCRLTGAAAATVVNNNAAAVLLALNTIASRREVPVSRGELIEIGGSFRLPEIMASAGCRLREIGTTNRVHRHDYEEAIGPRTGLVMKVHTSNYAIVGFTASVPEAELAAVCRERGVPFVVDLGSGTLADLRALGLPHEPTPADAIRGGADLVTFSGDKLLGGPQAGIIVGRADLIGRLNRNPMKRALRVDKITIAALASVLALYLDPDTLPTRLPVLRLLTRSPTDVRATAERLAPRIAAAIGNAATVSVIDCTSQIGSGAQPTEEIPSAGLALRARGTSRSGRALTQIAAAFRALPVPVIGRIRDDAFILDMRCLEDEAGFVRQLARLRAHEVAPG